MQMTVYFTVNDCEVEALADFDTDFEAPDRSVGYGGGWTADLTGLRLGGLTLNRAQAVKMLGEPVVDGFEDRAAWAAVREAA